MLGCCWARWYWYKCSTFGLWSDHLYWLSWWWNMLVFADVVMKICLHGCTDLLMQCLILEMMEWIRKVGLVKCGVYATDCTAVGAYFWWCPYCCCAFVRQQWQCKTQRCSVTTDGHLCLFLQLGCNRNSKQNDPCPSWFCRIPLLDLFDASFSWKKSSQITRGKQRRKLLLNGICRHCTKTTNSWSGRPKFCFHTKTLIFWVISKLWPSVSP